MQKRVIIVFAILSVLTIIAYALILNPTIQEKVGWHLNAWMIRVRTWLNPPEQVSFSALEEGTPVPDTLPSPNVESELRTTPQAETTPGPAPTFALNPDVFSLEPGQYFSQHYRLN